MKIEIPLSKAAEIYMEQQLILRGWSILARNFRRPKCEIDLIADKSSTLIFLEVKFRKNPIITLHQNSLLLPESKVKALQLGAASFLTTQNKTWDTMRFDLAVVTKKSPTNELSFEYFPNVV